MLTRPVLPRLRLLVTLLAVLALLLSVPMLDVLLPALRPTRLPDIVQSFATTFLGIFIEAAPFLLLGSVASGLLAEFVTAEEIARLFPRNRLAGSLSGALLGMVFPVCECGVVPVTRRLYQKGLPISAGVAFLLAAPVVNPVVIASTWAAFGNAPVFWGRIAFTVLIASGTGLVLGQAPSLTRLLKPRSLQPVMGGSASLLPLPPSPQRLEGRLRRALSIATDDFFDMGRFLVLGSLLAAGMQTFIPQAMLLAIGRDAISSVIALQALAFVLSVCSTVDSFLALSFVNTFTSGSILAFLVFGPMVDIKSMMMFWQVFRPRAVMYLLTMVFLAAFLMGVFVNYNMAW
ncbi:MAG: permease [Thermoflexales bacterium]